MNVYDFDNTIYSGESIIDFYLFCVGKNPSLIRYFPLAFSMLFKYKLGLISLSELEEKAARYVGRIFSEIDDISKTVKEFWDKNEKKIKPFYLMQKKEDDVIISASCDFLLEEITKRLNIKNHLFSELDLENGKIIQLCYNTNKPEIFKKHFPNAQIDNFYTDSASDIPMIELSKSAYLVKKDKIKRIK